LTEATWFRGVGDHSLTNQMELLSNASLLELGESDSANIKIERVP
jgi:hypothetical protein